MIRVFILLGGLAVLTANAQPPTAEGSLESQLISRLSKASSLISYDVKPNEIVRGPVAFSGIAVEMLKTSNPLQLFSPFAPAKYGSSEDNVLRDSVSGRASGWKLFSIGF